MPRTIESLQQIMHGLYPRTKLAHGVTPQLRVRCVVNLWAISYQSLIYCIRNGADENLIANTFACERLQQLLVGFAQGMLVKTGWC